MCFAIPRILCVESFGVRTTAAQVAAEEDLMFRFLISWFVLGLSLFCTLCHADQQLPADPMKRSFTEEVRDLLEKKECKEVRVPVGDGTMAQAFTLCQTGLCCTKEPIPVSTCSRERGCCLIVLLVEK